MARKLVPDADLRGELLRSALESLGCDSAIIVAPLKVRTCLPVLELGRDGSGRARVLVQTVADLRLRGHTPTQKDWP